MKTISSTIFTILISTFVSAFLFYSCSKDDPETETPEEEEMPLRFDPVKDRIAIKDEFRAAWLTTVGNYDWPPKGATSEAQQSALIQMIESLKSLNLNVILFHVRPTSDAFYNSSIVPWSAYLTGTQGQYPGFDPLQVAIDAAHQSGMELHAWLNPYRIGSTSVELAPSHPAIIHPEWSIVYNNNRYLNPGLPAVKNHLQQIVSEIIENYDVDGIHFDDYFYPSGAKSTTNPFGFNDQQTFEMYGSGMTLDAWREKNVNDMVQTVSQTIREADPDLVFGISPQGKHDNSMTVYANSLTWMQNKWIDYLAPQIYWENVHPTADFSTVIRFWNNSSYGVPIIPGLAAYKFGDSQYPSYTLQELMNQVDITRTLSFMRGNCWFRVVHILGYSLSNYIKNNIYPYKSLVPKLGSSSAQTPAPPSVVLNNKIISWQSISGADNYVVYELKRVGKTSEWSANAVQINSNTTFEGAKEKNYIVISVKGKERSNFQSVLFIE